jgi:hypothetical protein
MGYPQQPQQYPQQQPQYAPPPQQGYGPPPQGYPQQYTPPPAYASPPVPAGPRATIDDFYDQPAASGKSIASWFQTPGQSLTGIVARPITRADLRPQTDMQSKQAKYYSDGRPMLTMTVPLIVAPSPDFPDGRAAWIISSSDKEDLDIAMQAAGCPPRTVPEAGAVITITFTGFRQIPGFGSPKKVKQIQYRRPEGAAAAPAPQAEAVQQVAVPNGNGQTYQIPGPPPQQDQPPWQQAPPQPAQQFPAPGQGPIPFNQVPPPPQQQVPAPQPAPAQMPAGLTPEQQAQLAKLTGVPPQ